MQHGQAIIYCGSTEASPGKLCVCVCVMHNNLPIASYLGLIVSNSSNSCISWFRQAAQSETLDLMSQLMLMCLFFLLFFFFIKMQ